MEKTILLLFVLALVVACEKENTPVEYVDVEKEDWYINLKAPCEEDDVCKTTIVKAVYKKDTVYYTTMVGPLCDNFFYVEILNNKGELIKKYDYTSVEEFSKELTTVSVVYRCDEQ